MPIYSIQYKENKEWNGKPFVQATLIDADDNTFEGVSAWNGEFAGSSFEGELEKNDKGFWRIKKSATARKPNFDRIIEKKQQGIVEAQDKKAQNVSAAQDRNEIMWAKYSAGELIANHPLFQHIESEEAMLITLNRIATDILNSKLDPF